MLDEQQALAHLKDCSADTLPLTALMHVEVQYAQRLNLHRGTICLECRCTRALVLKGRSVYLKATSLRVCMVIWATAASRFALSTACCAVDTLIAVVPTLCMKSFFLPTLSPPNTVVEVLPAAPVWRYKRWSELRRRHMSVIGARKPCNTAAGAHQHG